MSHAPLLSPILRSIHTPDPVFIEDKDARADESLATPRESLAEHTLEGYSNIAGIVVPASHRIFARDDQDNVVPDPLMVSIDADQVELESRYRQLMR